MNNLVLHTIENHGMLQKNDRVIVALSGGADSVTLLDILNSVKEKYNLTIFLAHINHGLRGDEADRDENFCRELSQKYNAEIFVKKANVKELAKQQKISEELCGR
ncbi:MAG: ATP-binding protein, partial [Ruminococcus sp.]|nr:ATP-binding protein [Ruminococcus sp.]